MWTSVCYSYTIGLPQKRVFGREQVQTNDLELICGVPGSRWRCASVWFRRGILVFENSGPDQLHY